MKIKPDSDPTAATQQAQPSSCCDILSRSSLTARIISGSVGSIITSLVVTPLEVVKVRMQANAEVVPNNVSLCPRGCGIFVLHNGQLESVLPRSAVPYFDPKTGRLTEAARSALQGNNVGTFTLLRRIFRTEGFPGIYAGIRPTLVMSVPNTVMYFSAYDELVWRFRESMNWAAPLVAGGTARLVASTATAPFEFLRTRQASMVGSGMQGSMWADFSTIVRQEGLGSLYNGLRPTLWRDVPFSAIYWFVLEELRLQWKFVHPTPVQQAMQAFVNGAVAGLVAAALTTPFDVVKTRQQQVSELAAAQLDGVACKHDGAISYHNSRVAGTFSYLRHIAETEGLPGLWRGNQARMLKVAPACAIMISTYEFGKRMLDP